MLRMSSSNSTRQCSSHSAIAGALRTPSVDDPLPAKAAASAPHDLIRPAMMHTQTHYIPSENTQDNVQRVKSGLLTTRRVGKCINTLCVWRIYKDIRNPAARREALALESAESLPTQHDV